MYQQNQGQLPFPATQLMFPTGNYNYIPNIGLEPHLRQFEQLIPVISQALISEVQANARANALRIFLFNQMAQNGFQNAAFATLVKGAIEYFGYMVQRGMIQNPNQGITKAVADMVQFIAANNVRVYPALQQYEDPGKIAYVLQNFDMVTNDISRERSQGMYPGVQQQFGAPMGGGYPNNGMGPGTGFNPMGGTPNYQAAVGRPERSYGNGQNSGLFEPANSGMGNIQESTPGMTRNYGTRDDFVAGNNEPVVQTAIVDNLEQTEVYADLAEANRRWRPSAGSLYRPAFEPTHQKLIARKKNDTFFYEVKELGEFEMDPARHQLTKLFGPNNSVIAGRLNPAETSQKLAEAVSDAKTAVTGIDVTIDTYSRIVLDRLPIELGYDSVWVSGIVERLKRSQSRGNAVPINIIQWQSDVVKPVVIETQDQADFVRRLATMDSGKIILALKQHVDKLPSALLSIIDERLTAAVNTAIRTNMSIGGLQIDSFVDDWNDLVNIVSSKHGEHIAAYLVSNDEAIIKKALKLLSTQCANSVTQNIYDTGDDEIYPISYFTESVSFTMLEFFSSELDIDFIRDTSALLSKVNTRTWYDLAEQIFKEFGETADRHLIRTVDGKVLEIKKGWLADNAYIINLVD